MGRSLDHRTRTDLQSQGLTEALEESKGDHTNIGALFNRVTEKVGKGWWNEETTEETTEERRKKTTAKPEVVEPVDLWAKREAPPLPKGLLPPLIEQFAFNRAEVMGCDPSGLAMGALTACAAAIPDKTQLQSKTHDGGWTESTRMWVALGGPVSAMKSPIMHAVARPLTQIDKKLSAAYRQAKAEYDALKRR